MDPADAQRLNVEASPNMVRAIEPLLFIHPLGKMLPPPRPVRSREARLPRGRLPTKISESYRSTCRVSPVMIGARDWCKSEAE